METETDRTLVGPTGGRALSPAQKIKIDYGRSMFEIGPTQFDLDPTGSHIISINIYMYVLSFYWRYCVVLGD